MHMSTTYTTLLHAECPVTSAQGHCSFHVQWRLNLSALSRLTKALCPASSTADKTVRQVLSLSPVPASQDNHCSKMSVYAHTLTETKQGPAKSRITPLDVHMPMWPMKRINQLEAGEERGGKGRRRRRGSETAHVGRGRDEEGERSS